MFEKIKSIIQGKKTNLVEVDGEKEITRIRYIEGADLEVNQVLNRFDLLGHEIRSDTIEIYYGKKYLGRGYVADLAGVTVDVSHIIPPAPEYEAVISDTEEPITEDQTGAIIQGEGKQDAKKPAWFGGQCSVTPCMILEGSPKVTLIRFEYLREIDGAIIDDSRSIRYEKNPHNRIEIQMPGGKIGRGYVCGSGSTMRIRRDVKVKVPVKAVIGNKEQVIREEFSEIKFAGAIGKLSSGDRLPKLLSGMTGRENLIQLIIAFVAGLVIMGVL
jgi:hypothetical protein